MFWRLEKVFTKGLRLFQGLVRGFARALAFA